MVQVDNYVIETPIYEILQTIKQSIYSGKLYHISKSGDDIKVTCPFHNNGHEQKPSCHIRATDGIYHCFSCGSKGPFYSFVAQCLDISVDNAKQWLISRYGRKVSETINLGEPLNLERVSVSKYVAYSNDYSFKNLPNWCPYLAKRGLTRATCDKYEVKYDPDKRVVVFPCYDIKGNLVMLHTRSVDKKQFELATGVPKPVFGLYNIVKNNISKALITEGPFDALKANQFGFPACATLGNLSDSQIEQINNSGIKILYIMFDNDNAGRAFTRELKSKLNKSILVFEPKIPDGKKDVGDLTSEEFWTAVNNCSNFIV